MVIEALSFVAGVVAGGVASAASFGVGGLLVPLFAALFGVRLAVVVVSVPHLAGTALGFTRTRERVDRRVLRSLWAPSAAAALAGALVLSCLGGDELGLVLGALVVFTGLRSVAKVPAALPVGRRGALAAGVLSSLLDGLVGEQGGLRSTLLPGLGAPPAARIATATAIGLIADVARIPVYLLRQGDQLARAWPLVAAATAGALVGTLLGRSARDEGAKAAARPSALRAIAPAALVALGVAVVVGARVHVPGSAGHQALPCGAADAQLAIPAALPAEIPPDDELDAQVDVTRSWAPVISAPRWVVPAANLPAGVEPQASNNCVGLAYHGGRLFLAWRTAPTHFASSDTRMYVVSSADFGAHWQLETTVALGADVREPSLVGFKGRLTFSFFEGGDEPLRFEPRRLWRTERHADGTWGPLERWGRPGEIVWEMKERGGRLWKTSYAGAHYFGSGSIDVFFEVSDDGLSFHPVAPSRPSAYRGGVSEVGFEFDGGGNLWTVTRNEDGDATGFGSSVSFARAADLARWDMPPRSDPDRYDSPRLFRHGRDLYLIARRDRVGPFDDGFRFLPGALRKYALWVQYSLRPKSTTLYRVDTDRRRVVPLLDLPSAGDTAFPSIVRLDAHTFLVANYTSPLENPSESWIGGQTDARGTQIYLVTIRFEEAQAEPRPLARD